MNADEWAVRRECRQRPSRACPGRSLILAALGVSWLGWYAPLEGGQERVRLEQSVACSECRIELTRDLVLEGGAEELGGVSSPHFLVQDGRGRFYLTSEYSTGTVQVFDSTGQFLTTFGRSGQGPGEFQRITSAVVGPGDSLHLFDVQALTYTVVDPEYRVVRRDRLGARVQQAVMMGAGRLVVNASIPDAERFGYPLHLVQGDSLGPTIGPADPLEGRTRPEPGGMGRALAVQGDGTFFAAQGPNYVIDHWTVSGTRLKQFEREAPWFQKEDRTTPRGSGNPRIRALTTDAMGRLWLLAWVRSERFDELVLVRGYQPMATGELFPAIESRTGDLEDLRERVIEVLDPERGEVLATLRSSALFREFLGPDRVWSYEEDARGGRIVIWKMEFLSR